MTSLGKAETHFICDSCACFPEGCVVASKEHITAGQGNGSKLSPHQIAAFKSILASDRVKALFRKDGPVRKTHPCHKVQYLKERLFVIVQSLSHV